MVRRGRGRGPSGQRPNRDALPGTYDDITKSSGCEASQLAGRGRNKGACAGQWNTDLTPFRL
ncbi:hypothetical protein GCM10023322_06330 [Rugosimonospora acidiphila]|uniref:Uncharacterized protein n=1 Tax=Rugosimonospora acidiphila TaxID=556531 RepID=A0ABP9RJ36_9ACTN